jgi:D-glycero-D-manno-heptose 1,7-bisphosphate phosphatase
MTWLVEIGSFRTILTMVSMSPGCLLLTHEAPVWKGGSTRDTAARPTVFLDRDGVIIENRLDYVRSVADVVLLPGTIEAVRRLSVRTEVVFVTNQSVIGRGLAEADDIVAVHDHVVAQFSRAGVPIRGSAICPHAPAEDCFCRKPKPGMLRAAAAAWNCRLETSWMVGDALSDILAAEAAGAQAVLVRTGRGAVQQELVLRARPNCVVKESLPAAVEWILAAENRRSLAVHGPAT